MLHCSPVSPSFMKRSKAGQDRESLINSVWKNTNSRGTGENKIIGETNISASLKILPNEKLITLNSEQSNIVIPVIIPSHYKSKFKPCLYVHSSYSIHFFANISQLINSDYWHPSLDFLCYNHISALTYVSLYQPSDFSVCWSGCNPDSYWRLLLFLMLRKIHCAPPRPAGLLRKRHALI